MRFYHCKRLTISKIPFLSSGLGMIIFQLEIKGHRKEALSIQHIILCSCENTVVGYSITGMSRQRHTLAERSIVYSRPECTMSFSDAPCTIKHNLMSWAILHRYTHHATQPGNTAQITDIHTMLHSWAILHSSAKQHGQQIYTP